MAEYQLYCFAQSGNAYRAALMLNLIGADWEPVWVDFFGKGEQRTPEYRTNVNEMGEVPVLVHGDKKLTQSGVILTYLAERSGKFRPEGEDERARSAALDHLRQPEGQRLSRALSLPAQLRQAARRSGRARLSQGPDRRQPRHRRQAAVDAAVHARRAPDHRRSLAWSPTSTIRRRSSASTSRRSTRTSRAWLDRIKALPGWKHPYDLMPGHPLPGR